MKRLIAVAAVAASLATAFPDLQRPVMTSTEGESYTAGQLILELTPAQRGRVSIATENGVARFNIPALDELNRRWHVDEVAPLWRHPNPGPIAMKYGCDLQYLIQFDVDQDIAPVAVEYAALAEVEYACPNAWFPLIDVPNDTLFDYQWHLTNIGAPAAWEFAHGDSTVLIGVLDDGCEWHHPDIIDNLWINTLEDLNGNGRFDSLPPPDGDIDGLDQDGNGYPDDVIGYDFAVADPNPDPAQLSDDHGTHCWGISNARTDNAIGVAGVPWNVRNFGYRCGGSGGISLYAAIAAIYHLVPKDGFVVSMSFGGYSPYQPMADACQFAWENGLVLVGGAGNDGTNRVFYPANYDHVISVAASGPNDMKTSWSNYGTWIEVTAPGDGIYATVTNHGYGAKSGTSMSTPLVAGVIAWIKSAFPDLDNAQCCSLLYATCDSMPDDYYRDGLCGAGRVSIGNIILPRFHCDLVLTGWRFNDAAGNGNGQPDPGETAALIVTYANAAGWQNATGVTATLTCTNPDVVLVKSTAGFPDIAAGASGNCSNDSFVVRVPANSPPQRLTFLLSVDANPDPAYPDTNLTVLSGEPRLLLVDDDLGQDYEKWYTAACDSHGILYDSWDVDASGSPSGDTLQHYPVVVWFTGMDSTTTLTGTDRTNLAAFMDNGGNLLISGQGIAQQLQSEAFLGNYLHAEFVDNSTGKPFMVGIPGDPITEGDTMVAGGGGGANNGRSLDGLHGASGGVGCAFYKDYGDTTVYPVVRYKETDGYAVVFFSVPFEAIDHSTSLYLQKWTLLKRILDYFGERVPGVAEAPPVVENKRPYVLHISPNPFAGTATVSFIAPVSGRVELRTYAIDGRLADSQERNVTLGERTGFRLDGTKLANGTYLVQLVTPAGVFAQKTAVLR